MRRLIAAGLLPERAGQPVKAVVHVSLAELRGRDGDSLLEGEWVSGVQARWAGYRAGGSAGGSDGGAWLTGDAARARRVMRGWPRSWTGTSTWARWKTWSGCAPAWTAWTTCTGRRAPAPRSPPRRCQVSRCQAARGRQAGRGREAGRGRQAGRYRPRRFWPGRLRRGCCPARRCSGRSSARPWTWSPGRAGWRRSCGPGSSARRWPGPACRWTSGSATPSRPRSATRSSGGTSTAGGPAAAASPPPACEVHHTTHKAHGGKTSTRDCVLLCPFHHQVVIHRLGWTLVLNPDGTTTAWNKDRTKVLHSHGPPARAG